MKSHQQLLHILRRGLFSHFSPSTFLLVLTKKNTQRKNRKETITYVPAKTLQKYSQKKKKKKVIIEQVKLDKQMFLSW